MFDNIGKDLDEEANKRRALSLLLTVSGMGAVVAFSVAASFYVAAEVLLDDGFDEDMMEVLLDAGFEDDAPPPPPPPPPPPAAAEEEEEEEEEETEETPDDMTDEVKELDEKVEEKIKSDTKPAGAAGGIEGGEVDGVVDGQIGGIEDGVLGGQLGGVRVFHHSELEVKKRVTPKYPDQARELNLGDQRCLAKVFIDENGVPYDVRVENCPNTFHTVTREAILKWRWYPPKDGRDKVKAQTTIAVTYKMK